MIKLLLERGADVNSKNVKGKTPIDIASNGILPYLMNASLPANGMYLLLINRIIYFYTFADYEFV